MDIYSTKVSDVLQSSAFLQRHPGNSMLGSDIYASSGNSFSELVLRQRFSGRYVVDANNLNFGSQSTFFLSQGSVMNGLVVSGAITVPRYCHAPDLWALHAIESVELTISGSSSVQSLKYSGRSMLDYLLYSCSSNKVQAMKWANPYINTNDSLFTPQQRFSIPLHLFFSSPEIRSVFALDTSTLQSQILVNIRWKPIYKVVSGDNTNPVVLPTQFDYLYLRVMDQVEISNDFALANELRRDASLVYSLPGTYVQTYSQIQNVPAVGRGVPENQITLTSQPSGMLQYILVSCGKVADEGSVAQNTNIQPWGEFETIRVLYNGEELVRYDSREEIRLANAINTDKDNGVSHKLRCKTIQGPGGNVQEFDMASCIVIPFANEASCVARDRRQEHTKNYSGSTIQYFYTLSDRIELFSNTYPIDGSRNKPISQAYAQTAGDFRFNFTFVNAGLYEVSSQTVKLTM